MNPTLIFNDLENQSISLDWKCSIDDAVFIMTNHWKQWEPIFTIEKIKSLVENYNSEMGDVFLPALGQELSVYGLAVYLISNEEDNYSLVVIEIHNTNEFEQIAKAQKIDVELQKQPRKKLGSHATRLILADRIPCDRFPLEETARIEFSYPYSLQYIFDKTCNKFLNATRSIIDLRNFPPNIHPTSKISEIIYNKDLDLWAGVFFNTSEDVSIKVGKEILTLNNWKEVVAATHRIPVLSKIFWIHDSILVLHEETAWFLSSATNENASFEKILEIKKTKKYPWSTYPNVIKTLNGNVYVLIYFKLYLLKGNKLEPTGISFPENSLSGYFPSGNFKFSYVLNSKLVEVDILKRKTRYRALPSQNNMNSISLLVNEWAVLSNGGFTNKDIAIVQFWNTKTDTWHHLKLGAFGQYGVVNVALTNEGDAIFHSREMLFRVKDFMTKLNYFEKFTVESWSDNWLPEEETSGKIGFFDKLKSIFTR